jgi:hypothetical protein
MHEARDLLFGECDAVGGDDPLILDVIETVNDGDHLARIFVYGLADAEKIGVLLFTVGGKEPLDVSVIDGIIQVRMVGMSAPKWAVHGDRYGFSDHKEFLSVF